VLIAKSYVFKADNFIAGLFFDFRSFLMEKHKKFFLIFIGKFKIFDIANCFVFGNIASGIFHRGYVKRLANSAFFEKVGIEKFKRSCIRNNSAFAHKDNSVNRTIKNVLKAVLDYDNGFGLIF